MSKEVFNLKKNSFSGYLNKDGRSIATLGFTLVSEVLIFLSFAFDNGEIRVAAVNCINGELYFNTSDRT